MRKMLAAIGVGVIGLLLLALSILRGMASLLDRVGRVDTVQTLRASDATLGKPVAWLLGTPWYYPALGTVILALIAIRLLFAGRNEVLLEASKIPTSAFITVDHSTLNSRLVKSENIKDWKVFDQGFVFRQPQPKTFRMWTIFLLFEKPISAKQFAVTGIGCTPPIYDTKYLSPQHAIVTIGGDIAGMNLQLDAIF